MKQVQLKRGDIRVAPRVNDISAYPNIDSTYDVLTYNGERLVVRTSEVSVGIKQWSSLPSGFQGMAIYGNILVRMASCQSSATLHYIYRISDNGGLSEVGSFAFGDSGHSNAAQFAPTVEGDNAFPYLYVSDTHGWCVVLNIAADYTVTQVQKITVPAGWQVLIGDDGFIWALGNPNGKVRIIKYRKVAVSEGANITLTTDDILEDSTSEDVFPSEYYTFQGCSFKFGKAWVPIGNDGADKKRALFVYDCVKQKTAANIDLTAYNVELEDCDFWDDSLIIACYEARTYILKF